MLDGREGHDFPAIVIDEGEGGVEFQIADPAVVGRVPPTGSTRATRSGAGWSASTSSPPSAFRRTSPESERPGDELVDAAGALEHVELAVGPGAHRRRASSPSARTTLRTGEVERPHAAQ